MELFTDFWKLLNFSFIAVVILGSQFGVKYFHMNMANRFKILIFATLTAFIMAMIEVYEGNFTRSSVKVYIVSYLLATTLYELLFKFIFQAIHNRFGTHG